MSNQYDTQSRHAVELLYGSDMAPGISDSAGSGWVGLGLETSSYGVLSTVLSSVISADPVADDYAANTSTTGVVTVNGSVTGLLETGNDRDWFRVGLTGGDVYAFDLKGSASAGGTLSDPGLTLLDVTGNYLVFDHDSGIGADSQIIFSPPDSGAFFLSAQDVGNSGGSYTLQVTHLGSDDFAGSGTTTGTLMVGGAASGNIQFSDDQDWFRIELIAGRIYAFDMKGLDSASGTLPMAFLQLLTGTSAYLAADAGSGTGNDARLIYSPSVQGAYLLAAQGLGAPGTYTLTATDLGADDHIGGNQTTSLLTLDTEATGNIQFSSDQDWFRIDLLPGRVYAFDMQANASDSGTLSQPVLQLMNAAGTLLTNTGYLNASNNAHLIYSPQTEGVYYLSAEGGYGQTGSYSLLATLLDNDDHLGSAATTSTLTIGSSIEGNIQFSGDQDWFRITLTAGRIYQIDMQGVDSGAGTMPDPLLYLLDGSADPLNLAYDANGGTGSDARLVFSPLNNGDYYLSAQGYFREEGTYTLTLADIGADDHLGGTATTSTLITGSSIGGNIQYPGDQDSFRIELSAGQIYAFDLLGVDSAAGTLSTPFLLLRDGTGDFLTSNFDGGTGRDALITFSPAGSGFYYLQAQGRSASGGTYTLRATDLGTDDYAENTSTTGILGIGESRSGNIQFSSDSDWFRVDLVAGHFYAFNLQGTDSGGGTLLDPGLQLFDVLGTYLATDFDSGVGTDARLGFAATHSGSHYLSAFGSGGTGTYTLTASDLGVDDHDGSTATTSNLSPGGSSTGHIQVAGESDWFRIELSAGRIYQFELRGTDSGGGTLADPLLQLRDSAGNVLTSDDDSGTGQDARLNHLVSGSGTYYLAAYGYSGDAIGSYTLSARDMGVDDHGDSGSTTSTLALGSSIGGDLQFIDDQDWFRIDLTAGTTYVFRLQGANSDAGTLTDPVLSIADNSGVLLNTAYDYGVGAFLVHTPTSSGSYYLAARTYSSSPGGTYTLSALQDDHAHNPQTSGRIALGETLTGSNEYASDIDWFRVDLTAGTEYVFDVTGDIQADGSRSTHTLRLVDSTGAELAGEEGRGYFNPVNSGTYYLAVQGTAHATSYALSVGIDDYANGTATTGVLVPGTSITGTCHGSNDQDWIKITLTAGHSYAFSLEGLDSGGGTLADPDLHLHDSQGLELAGNLNGGFGRDAHLTHIATVGGTYYLSVGAQFNGGNNTGTYTLTARDLGSGYQAIPTSSLFPLSGTPELDGLIQGSAWQFSGPRVLTYSFNSVVDEGLTLGGVWTNAEKDALREALLAWETVANIHFVEIPGSDSIENNTADIAFGHTGSWLSPVAGMGIFPSPDYANLLLAELETSRAEYPRLEGDVLLSDHLFEMQYLNPGSMGFWVGLHELGHVLGLKHPFDDGANGRPTFLEQGIGAQDVSTRTTMSYDAPAYSFSSGYAATPMLLDIQAIQHLYGANTSYHNEDNVYTLADDGALRTLWDTGGNDWLDAGTLSMDVQLSLAAGSINQYGYQGSAIAIAHGISIENVRGGSGADTLIGSSGSNILDGGAGPDTLDGGPGPDSLMGGPGNDTYLVNEAGDRTIETSAIGGGIDTVQAALSWTLGAHLENLALTGGHRHSGTGNTLNNTLTGNADDNILDGGTGTDTLIGGAGNDTYVVDNSGDGVQESSGMGNDTVLASVNWTLGDHLENLVLTGTRNLSGTGNNLDNRLTGNGGANVLNGGAGHDFLDGASGNDILTGGIGADTFAFTTPLHALRNLDTLTDFVSGTDKIRLSSAIFREMGLSDAFFHPGATAQAPDDRILYNPSTGTLSYDADGTGTLAAIQFVVLSGAPALLYTDIQVV